MNQRMRLIPQFLGAWGTIDPVNRNVAEVPQIGWQGWADKYIKPLVDLGWTRFEIHNPGGADANEPMEADQFVESHERGLTWASKDFVKAFRPFTEKNIEIIAYLGSLKLDPTFIRSARTKWTADNWLSRFAKSYRLPMEAGMSIGFDTIFDSLPGSPDYQGMKLLQSLGFRTYCEPWPHVNAPNMWSENVIVTEQLYQNRIPAWAAPNDKVTGEICRVIHAPPEGETWETAPRWLPGIIRRILGDGHTAFISGYELVSGRVTPEKYLSNLYASPTTDPAA